MQDNLLLGLFNTISHASKPQKVQINAASSHETISDQIKSKIKTFRNWDCKLQIVKRRKSHNHNIFNTERKETSNNDILKNMLIALVQKSKDEEKKKNKLQSYIEELEGVKTERRQRLKRAHNPIIIIKHYMVKEGFVPTQEQNILMERIIKLKQHIDTIQPLNLQTTLNHIYKTMNLAVDLNQTRFLLLTIIMTGEICFQTMQFKSAFFFFTQALIASTCIRNWGIKLQALCFLGRISMQLSQMSTAVIFFKKALQYTWKLKDHQAQLKLYDWIGKCYYYDGSAKKAQYYHNRYILGQIQEHDSVIKRISAEMLTEYESKLNNKQTQNLNQLFLEYLRLPITNFSVYPQINNNKVYVNYENQTSPRKNREKISMNLSDFPDVITQTMKLLNQTTQFLDQIPDPQIHHNFMPIRKFGRSKKQIEFEQSNDYHKIVGIKIKDYDKQVLKLPINKQIQKLLKQKTNSNWWADILEKNRKEKESKLGNLRNKIQKSHLSYYKYPQERKRAQSLKQDKVNQTINKTLLNWIDPSKFDD